MSKILKLIQYLPKILQFLDWITAISKAIEDAIQKNPAPKLENVEQNKKEKGQ